MFTPLKCLPPKLLLLGAAPLLGAALLLGTGLGGCVGAEPVGHSTKAFVDDLGEREALDQGVFPLPTLDALGVRYLMYRRQSKTIHTEWKRDHWELAFPYEQLNDPRRCADAKQQIDALGELFRTDAATLRRLRALTDARCRCTGSGCAWHIELRLIDFLPPAVQALVGHKFDNEKLCRPQAGKPSRKGCANMELSVNCWSAVLEVLRRDAQALKVFFAPRHAVVDWLFESGNIAPGYWSWRFLTPPHKIARPFDLYWYRFGSTDLAHLQLHLVDGLCFEKTDNGHVGGGSLFRIVPCGTYDERRNSQTITVWQLPSDARPPDPVNDLGLENVALGERATQDAFVRKADPVVTIPFSFDGMGRAFLPQQAFDALLLEPVAGK